MTSIDKLSIPTNTPTLALRRFLDRSPCPFVDRARVFQCRPWSAPTVLKTSVIALGAELRAFLDRSECDLVALEIADASTIETATQAGSLLYTLLSGLREADPTTDQALTEGIEHPSWDFLFHGQSFFVSVFAPFYPDSHPRCSGEPGTVFILLQPERGFRRFGVSARRPDRQVLSARVETRFKLHGHPYDAAANQVTPKALRYVKPVAPGDPLVTWWEQPTAELEAAAEAAPSRGRQPCARPDRHHCDSSQPA